MPRLKLFIDGTDVARDEFLAMAARARDASPVMREIQKLMLEGSIENFETRGGRLGHPWLPDSPGYLARKTAEGYRPGLEEMTGSLRDSLTVPEGGEYAGEIRKVLKTSTVFGTTDKSARWQGHKRELLGITMVDADLWGSMILEWILSGG
jgi:phage gpG-like protein